MPQIQTIYDGNFIVWQRKLSEVIVDLKTDKVDIQKFGCIIAESDFFKFTVATGIYLTIDISPSSSPNSWATVYSGNILAGAGWTPDINNSVPGVDGAWHENSYIYDNGANITGRYIRYRFSADASLAPLQTVALKKVLIRDASDNSLTAGASAQSSELGWQTGQVLQDIMEDLLENRTLVTTLDTELIDARTSPKGTWDNILERYDAPIPNIFISLKARLDDLEQDAERRLAARKVIIPSENELLVNAGVSEVDTGIVADAPYRIVNEYANPEDTVDVMVQSVEGIGSFEEPLMDNGVLIYAKVTYGKDTTGYVSNENAKITLYRSDNDAVYSLPTNRTLKVVMPIETDLYHMDKYDLTRVNFANGVIQDIGVLNDISAIQKEISDTLLSDTVTQDLVVYEDGGLYYADLAFDSNATASIGWQVSKDGAPGIPGNDFEFVDSQKIRLITHDNFAPTSWAMQYFTKDRNTLDEKINEIIEAIARVTMSILSIVSNIDEINDALVIDSRMELIQYDYSDNDGFDYFEPLTYKVEDSYNGMAVLYKNNSSVGAKDTVWSFRDDGVVALHRASMAYDRNASYSIRYYFKEYEHLKDKLQDMIATSDRDLIAKNWKKTNPVPPTVESDGITLI